jgi:hypothetical protein
LLYYTQIYLLYYLLAQQAEAAEHRKRLEVLELNLLDLLHNKSAAPHYKRMCAASGGC